MIEDDKSRRYALYTAALREQMYPWYRLYPDAKDWLEHEANEELRQIEGEPAGRTVGTDSRQGHHELWSALIKLLNEMAKGEKNLSEKEYKELEGSIQVKHAMARGLRKKK